MSDRKGRFGIYVARPGEMDLRRARSPGVSPDPHRRNGSAAGHRPPGRRRLPGVVADRNGSAGSGAVRRGRALAAPRGFDCIRYLRKPFTRTPQADGGFEHGSATPCLASSLPPTSPRFSSVRLFLLGLPPLVAVAAENRATGGKRLERKLFDRLSAFGTLQVVDANVIHLSAFGSHRSPLSSVCTASLPAEAGTRSYPRLNCHIKQEPRCTGRAPRIVVCASPCLDHRSYIESLGALLALTQGELDLLTVLQ